jgi:hypothetical protein
MSFLGTFHFQWRKRKLKTDVILDIDNVLIAAASHTEEVTQLQERFCIDEGKTNDFWNSYSSTGNFYNTTI